MFREQRQYGRNPEVVVRSKTKFAAPLKWDDGRLVFTCSWSDWFHPDADEWRDEAWEVVRATPQHTYQILTKRPGLIPTRLPKDWGEGYPNVWLGVSIESAAFNWRARKLAEVPAALRFLSCEPLIDSLYPLPRSEAQRLRPETRGDLDLGGIGWVIVGGESGAREKARPMHPQWAREIRDAVLAMELAHPDMRPLEEAFALGAPDDVLAEGIAHEMAERRRPAFHMKQWGSWTPDPHFPAGHHSDAWFVLPDGARCTAMYADANGLDLTGAVPMRYAGPSQHAGGKLLDGVDWCEIPDRHVLA